MSPDFESSEPLHSILPSASFFYSNHSSPPLSSILISLDAASESTEWAEAGRVPAGLSGEDEALKVMEKGGATCAILCRKKGEGFKAVGGQRREEEQRMRTVCRDTDGSEGQTIRAGKLMNGGTVDYNGNFM